MMRKIEPADVRRLDGHRARPCVSLYMGLDPVWPGGPSDRARVAGLLRKAARGLARELDHDAIDRMLIPVAQRVREAWPPGGRAIALFRSPELELGLELPVEVADHAVVAPTFDTRPLLPCLAAPEQAEAERAAVDRYLSFRRAAQATDVLGEVISAVSEGRVRVLLRRRQAEVWGRMDPERGTFVVRHGTTEVRPGDTDLVGDLSALTRQGGGDVVDVAPERMPTELPVAAILRY